MSSTVQITHYQEERVIQEARLRNLSPQQFLDQLLEDALQRLSQQSSTLGARQESAVGIWEEKLRAIGVNTGISLPDEATRREYIYED